MDRPIRFTLRNAQPHELDALYQEHIQHDFPSEERPSLSALRHQMREGLQEVLLMCRGDRAVAYAVCVQANGVVLVSLLAVFGGNRGGGYGTRLLSLLRERYAQCRLLLLEVEDPARAPNAKAKATMKRRIAFYERFGFGFFEGVEQDCFGVPLLVMALPLCDSFAHGRETAVEDLRAVYDMILPPHLRSGVKTTEQN